MKNNLISAIAGWKSTALLVLIAMVAAVAFSGVLTNGQTADAATVTLGDQASTVDAEPGDTVVIPNGGAADVDIVDFSITGGTASGSFDTGGGQSVSCSDSTTGRGCDGDDDDGDITVKLNIDEDSADGYIIVKRDTILPVDGTDDTVVITVTTQPKPASLTAKSVATTINASDGMTQIVGTVKSDEKPAEGMNDQLLTFVTTLGTMNCPASGTRDAVQNVQWCQVSTTSSAATGQTAANGNAVITLNGSGREGTATVTISHGTLDPTTVEVTLFGTAKNLSAAAEQGSVEIGGTVFVVLTVTDAAGNPVSGSQPEAADDKAIVGPSDDANAVETAYNVDKDAVPAAGVKGIPACLDEEDDDTTNDVDEGAVFPAGTNDAGQCVVQVSAPDDDEDTPAPLDETAARGANTLNFMLATTPPLTASVEVTVAGAPSVIESDAPASVEELSDTKITITVTDDDLVLVGKSAGTAVKVAGQGIIGDGSKAVADLTVSNGSAAFTYTAGLGPDTVVFRVTVGKALATISIDVVDPDAEEEVVEDAPTWSVPLSEGWNLVAWLGEDDTAVGDAVGDANATAVYSWSQAASWTFWFSESTSGVSTDTLSTVSTNQSYFVYVAAAAAEEAADDAGGEESTE